jgi:hypothetical protein
MKKTFKFSLTVFHKSALFCNLHVFPCLKNREPKNSEKNNLSANSPNKTQTERQLKFQNFCTEFVGEGTTILSIKAETRKQTVLFYLLQAMKTIKTTFLITAVFLLLTMSGCEDEFIVEGNGITQIESRYAGQFSKVTSDGDFQVIIMLGTNTRLK